MPSAAPSLEGRSQAALPCILLSGGTVSEAAPDDLCLVCNLGQGLQKHGASFLSCKTFLH